MVYGLKLHVDPVGYRLMYTWPNDTSGGVEEGTGGD
jgi:hypothetical protein